MSVLESDVSEHRRINIDDPRIVKKIDYYTMLYQVQPQEEHIPIRKVEGKPSKSDHGLTIIIKQPNGSGKELALYCQYQVHFLTEKDARDFKSECEVRRSKAYKERCEDKKIREANKVSSRKDMHGVCSNIDGTGFFQFRFSDHHKRLVVEVVKYIEIEIKPTEDNLRKQIMMYKTVLLSHLHLIEGYWPDCKWAKCGRWKI